jgi:Bacterial lipid A biosynthesis acyltransferase
MRAVLKALTHLPLPIMYAVGYVVFFIVFYLMRWRRDRAKDDIANAFPEMSPKERAAILKASYRNLADTVAESFWGFGSSARSTASRRCCCWRRTTATGSGCCSPPARTSRFRSTWCTNRSASRRSMHSCATCAAASAAS